MTLRKINKRRVLNESAYIVHILSDLHILNTWIKLNPYNRIIVFIIPIDVGFISRNLTDSNTISLIIFKVFVLLFKVKILVNFRIFNIF